MNTSFSRPLRLGVVGPLPPPAGGMATQTRQLVDLLQDAGVHVALVQTNKPYRPAIVEKIRGVRALFRLLPYLFSVWRMAGRVEVIHLMANSGWSWQLFSAPVIWLASLRKTPVIVNYRGGEARSYFENSFHRVRPTLKRATRIVVPSGFLKKVFAEFNMETTVIPNIINLERFCPSPTGQGERQNDNAPFKLIITRNLEPIYGIRTAIEALALVRREIPNVQLAIAGSGPQKSELEHLVTELGLEDCVTFTGRLNADQIVDFYQSADVMVNPTTVDNMPNSVLESLACGVPVVTTDVGGIPYIVTHEETALLVPVGDKVAMANGIISLFRDEVMRKRLVSNGLDTVKPYAWPQVKGQWLSLYEMMGAGK